MFLSRENYFKLVSEAYDAPHGPAHKLIMRKFRSWMGMDKTFILLRPGKKFQHLIRKAARQMAESVTAPDLGFHGIGFRELEIHCYKTDTNSASVYLFGMSDNYPIFKIYEHFIQPGSTVVDIGANIGIHTLVMADLCANDGRVFAFEPSANIFDRLKENIRWNRFDNVIFVNKAIGNDKGEIGFDDNSKKTNIGTSHVNRLASSKVTINKLDDELPEGKSIRLIKIDVEGFELDVLKGAINVLLKNKPIIVLEFNPKDYSLTELMALLPYPVDIYITSVNLYAAARQIVRHNRILYNLQNERNILILPADASVPGPNCWS